MLTVSLTDLLGEAVAVAGMKHLGGNVTDPDRLFTAEAMAKLEAAHRGVFAFLAHHPVADNAVNLYIKEGTLADDSGGSVLCLFTQSIRQQAVAPPAVLEDIVQLEGTRSSASLAIEHLFAPAPPPPMPGIAFFASFEQAAPVYVSMADLTDSAAVRARLRTLFAMVADTAAYEEDGALNRRRFSADLRVALQKKRITHVSPGVRSMRAWLIHASQVAWDHRDDFVTAAGLTGLA